MDAINVELCPRCRASIALTSYTLPFEEDFARGFYNPSSTEKSSIESSLSDSSAELAMLTEEIQRAEVFLRALKIHHAHLERYIHRTTRFIQFSPIRQLPTEILGIIFASACSSCQEDEYKTPLSISLVCSKWRHIAMSTPTLWTNIYVAPYSSARGLPVYQYFLQRCGMIPISVKVEVPAIDHPYQDDDGVIPFKGTYEHHLDVMSDIYASFAQWKHAEFHMKQVADVLLLEDLDDRWRPQMKQSNCPILESLTLAISVYTASSRLPRVFRDALLLSSVNIINCRESEALLQIPGLPWENIRRVQTNQRNTASLRYMQYNRDFQAGILVLNATNQTWNYYTHSPRACPLNITTLILDRPWAYALCQFLRHVSIPTLEALTIIFRDPENTHPRCFSCFNPLLSLPLFLDHTHRRLNMFSLIMYGWYNDNELEPTLANSLVDALHEMGHLKSLQVIESNNGPPVLSKRLFEELSADALLPELTSLELVWAESRQPDEELLSALSLRADGRRSSVVLGIRNRGNLGPEALECMRSLRQNNVQAMCW